MTEPENRIYIEDGQPIKCPQCENIIAIRNDGNDEIKAKTLYRNISFLYSDGNKITVKCRKCKNLIDT